jgi:hypothetical protein
MPYQKVFTLELITTVERDSSESSLSDVTQDDVVRLFNDARTIIADNLSEGLNASVFLTCATKPEPGNTISERITRIEGKIDKQLDLLEMLRTDG